MSNKKEVVHTSSGGVGCLTLTFLVFLVLKLTHVITWSWWWVCSPLLLQAGILILFLFILMMVLIFAGIIVLFLVIFDK